ncbi:hypothetical protein CcaCcLH18_03020 [Colletotrichum camelliae]|nr:hypothetical protein CcaCcLH18_03020 [Colletotrichum camelliae]
MAVTKRALLIASPFGGLRGPSNDVKIMKDILSQQNFDISTLCGDNATREGILKAWERLIEASQPEDAVVIYYSAHGGIVEDDMGESSIEKEGSSSQQQSWRYQFLVPMDYLYPPQSALAGVDSPFNGILDVELERLLRLTTSRTKNVTTIFDCCHAGRMARDPSHVGALPRNVPKVPYAAVSRQISHLCNAAGGPAEAHSHVDGNPLAVRIAASGAMETAWEDGDNDNCAGVMTRELAQALREAWDTSHDSFQVPWQHILLRVRELVNLKFPQQNPHVDGPHKRVLFCLEESKTESLSLHLNGEQGILKAGRVSGVREGNVYALMPSNAKFLRSTERVGTATVTKVKALESVADLSNSPAHGIVLAFLIQESLPTLPVACPDRPDVLRKAIDASKYLHRIGIAQDTESLATIQRDEEVLTLSDDAGRLLLSTTASDGGLTTWAAASESLVKHAEQLARANHLLRLTCSDDEKLGHALTITFGTIEKERPCRVVDADGGGEVTEGDHVYISLQNNGANTVYVSVFDINVSGIISLVSADHTRGIEVAAGRAHHIGAGRLQKFPRGPGLPVSWPSGISKTQAIPESLVFILTDSPVDLTVLASGARGDGNAGPSSLEQLAFSLATGTLRDIGSERVIQRLQFDILRIPFKMNARGVKEISSKASETISASHHEAGGSY